MILNYFVAKEKWLRKAVNQAHLQRIYEGYQGIDTCAFDAHYQYWAAYTAASHDTEASCVAVVLPALLSESSYIRRLLGRYSENAL